MDRNQNQTTSSGDRSAIGGQTPKFSFPKSNVDQAMREVSDFVLIDPSSGKIWTSLSDHKYVDKALREAVDNLQPAT